MAKEVGLNTALLAKGIGGVDILEAAVLSCFEGHGERMGPLHVQLSGGTVVTILQRTVGLEGLMWEETTETAARVLVDIEGFVHKIVLCLKRNPILLFFGTKYEDLGASFRPVHGSLSLPRQSEEEIRLAVVHSFVMDAITEALLYETVDG